jgi:enoyl-CoA hydratase
VTRLEREGDGGIVVIDEPPLNLFGRELTQAVLDAVGEAEGAEVRALVVRAEGEVFTGGADVHVFDGLEPDASREFTGRLMDLTHRLEDLPIPTIACVHSLCLTAGFELSLACDMIWAAESARFGLVERVVGLTPLMGGTQRVAERWNLVNRVLPDDELREKTMRFAVRLAGGPTLAHGATKRIVRAFLDHGVRGADERTADIGAPLFASEDLRGAVLSFLEEGPGKATFEGR